MNIEEKLAESNELLMDTSLSGLTVAIDGLIWKPQFAEYLCDHHGLDVYKITFNRATCPRWYWWKYWSRNRSTVTKIVVAEKNWADYGHYWSRCLLRNLYPQRDNSFEAKIVGHGDTLIDALALLNRRRKMFVVRKLTDAA
jgi:hypothetical protein